jgi:hypothetical protein
MTIAKCEKIKILLIKEKIFFEVNLSKIKLTFWNIKNIKTTFHKSSKGIIK